ncbi:ATP-dependent DNA ligase [Streptomyces sp. NPDC057438]|uniref:ATP-dependent DNA ligase n=1 Tax=Streptomyces sp. NPDC057438 TaxID=3346133 RepID=UPI0036A1949B
MGSQEKPNVTLVEPELVVEVGGDVTRDASADGDTPHAGTVPGPTSPPADLPRWTSPAH